MMFARTLSFVLLSTLVLSVLSDGVTFKNVKIQYETDTNKNFTVEINSAKTLKTELNAAQVTRIKLLEGSIPIVYADAFSDFPALKELQLSQSDIEEIHPGAFSNVPVLATLKLSKNKLTTINQGVFANLNLHVLDLEYNSIEDVSPHAFDNLANLESLELGHNKIKIFHPEWLQGKEKLEEVSLDYNQIEELPSGAFANYHNGVRLNNNKIRSVSRNIFGSDDKIVFGELWLDGNEIEEWKEDFVTGAKLAKLDISENKLQCLEGNYENFFAADYNDIDGNPWNCECLLKIAKWLVSNDDFTVAMPYSAEKCNSTGHFPTIKLVTEYSN